MRHTFTSLVKDRWISKVDQENRIQNCVFGHLKRNLVRSIRVASLSVAQVHRDFTHPFINSLIVTTSKVLLTTHKIKEQKQHPYVSSWLFSKREAFKQSTDHSEWGLAKETNFLDPAEVSAKQLKCIYLWHSYNVTQLPLRQWDDKTLYMSVGRAILSTTGKYTETNKRPWINYESGRIEVTGPWTLLNFAVEPEAQSLSLLERTKIPIELNGAVEPCFLPSWDLGAPRALDPKPP